LVLIQRAGADLLVQNSLQFVGQSLMQINNLPDAASGRFLLRCNLSGEPRLILGVVGNCEKALDRYRKVADKILGGTDQETPSDSVERYKTPLSIRLVAYVILMGVIYFLVISPIFSHLRNFENDSSGLLQRVTTVIHEKAVTIFNEDIVMDVRTIDAHLLEMWQWLQTPMEITRLYFGVCLLLLLWTVRQEFKISKLRRAVDGKKKKRKLAAPDTHGEGYKNDSLF
jgi:hypothetical protein